MSWGYGITAVPAKDVPNKLEETQAASFAAYPEPPSQEVMDQAELAVKVAVEIVQRGVVGDDTKKFTISLSGHGNPNHEPQEGFVNDMIHVNVQQST